MFVNEISDVVQDYAHGSLEVAEIVIQLRNPKGPWDERTKELIEEHHARYKVQQRILNNYARAEHKLSNDKKSTRQFKRASNMSQWAYTLGIIPGKETPWDQASQKAIRSFDAKTDLEIALFRMHSHINYELQKESTPIRKAAQKTAYFAMNELIIGSLVQGSLVNSLNEKMSETVTKVPKRRAELTNSLTSNIDHIPIILGMREVSQAVADTTNNLYATKAADTGEYLTIGIAITCLAWNGFRAGRNIYHQVKEKKTQQDNGFEQTKFSSKYKTLPSIGYGSAIMHSKHFMEKGKEKLRSYTQPLELKAKSLGTNQLYAGIIMAKEDFKNTYFKKSTRQI